MFNKILLILLAIALIGFVVVLAVLAKNAIETLNKVKTFVNFGQNTVETIKGKFENLTNRALTAVNKVIDDSSIGVKAVATVGLGLTAVNLIGGFVGNALRKIGIIW